MGDIKKQIREDWFKDHVATLNQHGDLQVLDWKRPNSRTYYCRYVFDGAMLYISGDIGTAVFWLTWKAEIHSFNDLYIGYFKGKMSACSDNKMDFNSESAVKRLREWTKQLKKDEIEYDHDDMRKIFDLARECDNKEQWGWRLQSDEYGFVSDLAPDYWEWIYNAGDEIPARIHAYLIGLQMASEQLTKLDGVKNEV